MRHRLRVLSIIAIAAVVVLLYWSATTHSRGHAAPSNLQKTFRSAVTNPAEFVRSRVTGGVGLLLRVDNATGLPQVNSVLAGSPAESAGLRPGDWITKVNDWGTAGQPLAQVVDALRGITGGRVTVTVKRPGSTNLTFVIKRTSWNTLRGTNSFPTPASGPIIR